MQQAGSDHMNGFSTGEEDSRGPPDQVCCLVDDGIRCHRPAGNASYSKRIQKTVTQRRLKLHLDHVARHIYICDYHKGVIQSARSKRRRKDSEDDSNETDTDVPEVDMYQLQVNTLRRYKRHFKVATRPGLNKAQLADCVIMEVSDVFEWCSSGRDYSRHLGVKTLWCSVRTELYSRKVLMKHFKTIPVNEKEILTYFLHMVKCNGNKLDQKNGGSEHGSER